MQLIWFRNDLRTDDHELLSRADPSLPLAGVYFFDPRQYGNTPWGFPKTGNFRGKFIRESVIDLKESLDALNIPFLVLHERPEVGLPRIVQDWGVDRIYLQKEWTWEEKRVEEACRSACPTGVKWISAYMQFLFHPWDLPYDGLRELPEVFTAFRKDCEKRVSVRSTFPLPAARPPFPKAFPQTSIPTLDELGLQEPKTDPRSAFPFSGGEMAGKERLQDYFWRTHSLSVYKKTRNGLVGTDYSSKLSAWLAVGALSPRRIYEEVKAYESAIKKNQDTYWMIFELIWRDYFKYISMKHGNAIFQIGGILSRDYDWEKSRAALEEWTGGTTPEPFVNANMKELASTGWMSNRGRQNVASYWAKQLRQDWRIGASYFESRLIDYDVHSNWGNWMYNSGVGNDPRDRMFNIRGQAEKYDPAGKFQRLWLNDPLL